MQCPRCHQPKWDEGARSKVTRAPVSKKEGKPAKPKKSALAPVVKEDTPEKLDWLEGTSGPEAKDLTGLQEWIEPVFVGGVAGISREEPTAVGVATGRKLARDHGPKTRVGRLDDEDGPKVVKGDPEVW